VNCENPLLGKEGAGGGFEKKSGNNY